MLGAIYSKVYTLLTGVVLGYTLSNFVTIAEITAKLNEFADKYLGSIQ